MDAAQGREWRPRGGLPIPGRCLPADVRQQKEGGRAVTGGTRSRQGKEAGATLPYLTKGNVATKPAEITETGGMNMDADDLYIDDDDDIYNRRTTDYGNGKIEIVSYYFPRPRYIEHGKPPSDREAETTDKAQEGRTHKQIHAIRRRIKGYAFSNDFHWFVTLTFNPEKVDSFDYETAKTTLLKWCRKMRDRHEKFDYLMIPELHKSGAVHFHGLLGDIPNCFKEAANPKNGKPIIRHGRQVYNLTEWEYGFSDCEEIESRERAASYITKYVTAALLNNKEMYQKKRYFNSQGLAKPTVTYGMSDNTDLEGFTPNFGIVDTDEYDKNFIDIGIYNLDKDLKTGILTQTDDNYLRVARYEHFKNSPTGVDNDNSKHKK